jgi:hypothetical protein
MPFDRGNRTYYFSDDRLRAFRALSPADKLRWVEQLAAFLRLVQPVESAPAKPENTISLRRLANRWVKLHILIGQSWASVPNNYRTHSQLTSPSFVTHLASPDEL